MLFNKSITPFSKVMILFFIIPFPIFLYYNIKVVYSIRYLKDQNPYLALGLVAVSIALWLFLSIKFAYEHIIMDFVIKNNLEKMKTNGILRESKILNSDIISKPNSKFPAYELKLSFKNLSNAEVTEKISIVDTRPNERRFETGKNLNIILDREVKHTPYFALTNSNPSINILAIVLKIAGLLTVISAVVFYYCYAYKTESYGMGWLFMRFLHPLISCPFNYIIFSLAFKYIMGTAKLNSNDKALLKFKGLKTTARILSANQTGTYINNQPVVAFEIEYTDERNQVHQNTIKKIVNLLNVGSANQGFAEIIYLPENPNKFAFASDL